MNIKYLPYIIFQCTRGIIQTLTGLIMCLINHGEKHMFCKGSIATFRKRPYGISFIKLLTSNNRVHYRVSEKTKSRSLNGYGIFWSR